MIKRLALVGKVAVAVPKAITVQRKAVCSLMLYSSLALVFSNNSQASPHKGRL